MDSSLGKKELAHTWDMRQKAVGLKDFGSILCMLQTLVIFQRKYETLQAVGLKEFRASLCMLLLQISVVFLSKFETLCFLLQLNHNIQS